MIEPNFFNVWYALMPFIIGGFSVLYLDFYRGWGKSKKISIFSLFFFMFFGVFLIYHIIMLTLISFSGEEDLLIIQGEVADIYEVNSGYSLYVNDEYFKIDDSAFYCVNDVPKVKKGENIKVLYYRPIDQLNYKCVRKIFRIEN